VAFFEVQLETRQLQITFEDRATRNSFSLAAALELSSILDQYSGQFDVLKFFARGRVFCSGGTLSDYAKMTQPDEGQNVNRRITAALTKLALLSVPTFCFVEGDAYGGGVELLSAFDFVYTAPHVIFGLWQRRIGLTFGWGGGARVERRIGEKRVVQLSLTTEAISAREALAIGLIDGIFLPGQMNSIFDREWKKLARLPRTPIGVLKRWVASEEQALFEGLWWNDEHRAALARFLTR
jgi:enoyl-CoA hydratase